MILVSTLRRLQERNLSVWIVESSQWTMKAGAIAPGVPPTDRVVPAYRNVFASEEAARRDWAVWANLMEIKGGPATRLRKAAARSLDGWTTFDLPSGDAAGVAGDAARLAQRVDEAKRFGDALAAKYINGGSK